MCLYSYSSLPQKAKKPITCYKIIVKIEDTLCAPIYLHYVYGKCNKSLAFENDMHGMSVTYSKVLSFYKKLINKIFGKNSNTSETEYVINHGFHTYKNEKDAIKSKKSIININNLEKYPYVSVKVITCQIPENALYYEGKVNNSDIEGYCSNELNIDDTALKYGYYSAFGINYFLAMTEFKNSYSYNPDEDTLYISIVTDMDTYSKYYTGYNENNYIEYFRFPNGTVDIYSGNSIENIAYRLLKDMPQYKTIVFGIENGTSDKLLFTPVYVFNK